MASAKAIAWVERLVWILVYGGLFGVVLGLATRAEDAVTGWSLVVAGGCIAAAGAVLIWVRSRMNNIVKEEKT
jgi:hypothetical protein